MVDESNPQDDGFFLEDEDMLAAEPSDGGGSSEGARPDFKEIWRSNPSLKVFAVVAGIGLLLVSFMVFGSDDEAAAKKERSVVASTTGAAQAPGTAELPPAYEEAVRAATAKRIEDAVQTGGSALPTPIARPAERIEAPVQIEEKDPLSEWRREAEARRAERKKEDEAKAPLKVTAPPPLPTVPVQQMLNQQQAAPVVVAPPPPPPPLPTSPTPEQIQAYAGQMSQQISTVMQTQIPKESIVIKLSGVSKAKTDGTKVDAPASARPGANAATQSQQAPKPKPLITAGTIAYAQTLTEANSDVPGPILAEIASGPLVGGRAIGTFQVSEDKLVLQFSRIVKDGVDYQVQTFAIDPATTLTAMSTDVDRHYFSRVFLPAAATFVRAYAQAVSQQDTTVVVTNGTVVSESQNKLNPKEQLFQALNQAGQRASTVVDEDSQRPITVKVGMGTRIGLLFVENVFDPATQMAMNQQQQTQQQQAWGQAMVNATPYGQVYNAANNVWGSQQQNVFPGAQPQTGVAQQAPAGQQPPQQQPMSIQQLMTQPR